MYLMTTFTYPITTEIKDGDPVHDPAGPAIQMFELPDEGGLLLTFDPNWLRSMDWRIDDTIDLIFDDVDPQGMSFRNRNAEARREQLEDLRARVNEVLAGGSEL
jgi:hypothetical protein